MALNYVLVKSKNKIFLFDCVQKDVRIEVLELEGDLRGSPGWPACHAETRRRTSCNF